MHHLARSILPRRLGIVRARGARARRRVSFPSFTTFPRGVGRSTLLAPIDTAASPGVARRLRVDLWFCPFVLRLFPAASVDRCYWRRSKLWRPLGVGALAARGLLVLSLRFMTFLGGIDRCFSGVEVRSVFPALFIVDFATCSLLLVLLSGLRVFLFRILGHNTPDLRRCASSHRRCRPASSDFPCDCLLHCPFYFGGFFGSVWSVSLLHGCCISLTCSFTWYGSFCN